MVTWLPAVAVNGVNEMIFGSTWYVSALSAVPPGVITETTPVTPAVGMTALSEFPSAATLFTFAVTPPTFTDETLKNPAPVTVIVSPT